LPAQAHEEAEEHVRKGDNKMNNPFGLPDEVFDAILSSAVRSSITPGMSKPNPETEKQATVQSIAKAQREIYNSYVAVGFSEEQAFELLKTVVSSKR
jgi:23S rRNA maturation mini-RNase III